MQFFGGYDDRTNAPIDCPLKKSTIAWPRCAEYRKEFKCLCREARARLKLKGEGQEAFAQKLREVRKPRPDRPEGWTVEKLTRFYVIRDAEGKIRHRATNQAECDDYLRLAAAVQTLEEENTALWDLLNEDLTGDSDPWDQVDDLLAAQNESGPVQSG